MTESGQWVSKWLTVPGLKISVKIQITLLLKGKSKLSSIFPELRHGNIVQLISELNQKVSRSTHQVGEREESSCTKKATKVFFLQKFSQLWLDPPCARCENQLSGGRCPRLSIHPQHCTAPPTQTRQGRRCLQIYRRQNFSLLLSTNKRFFWKNLWHLAELQEWKTITWKWF